MLDPKLIRKQPKLVRKKLAERGFDTSEFDKYLELDEKRRKTLEELQSFQQKRNEISKKIGLGKKNNEDIVSFMAAMEEINSSIKALDETAKELELETNQLLFTFPNLQHDSVPVGKDESENVEARRIGNIPTFSFTPLPHEEIGEKLNLFDFSRAAKVTGSRFVFYKGLGASLERALINFMLDVHTEEHGYTEMIPPYMVNEDSLFATGQLPKFKEDLFQTTDGKFLIPTAEVPVTNYHRGEILSMEDLPISYTAHSACFRSEAGSAGRDTKGLIRQHQFNKVELVKLVKPEDSYTELENITNDAEKILKLLELPYRVVTLCTGDAGFGSAKTYDLEVWFPAQNKYREISSATNFEDFQARRTEIRFKRTADSKTEFVHTLNASGLAVGRTVAAILENYQNEDGTVTIPKVLISYMRNKTVLEL